MAIVTCVNKLVGNLNSKQNFPFSFFLFHFTIDANIDICLFGLERMSKNKRDTRKSRTKRHKHITNKNHASNPLIPK